MNEPVKMIPVETVLTGIKTFKKCYEETEKDLSPVVVEVASTTLEMVEQFVKKTPAMDAVEVVHGRWIHTEIEDDEEWGGTWHKWSCSNCDFSTGNNPTGTNYCPNCGAKMDGGADHGKG